MTAPLLVRAGGSAGWNGAGERSMLSRFFMTERYTANFVQPSLRATSGSTSLNKTDAR